MGLDATRHEREYKHCMGSDSTRHEREGCHMYKHCWALVFHIMRESGVTSIQFKIGGAHMLSNACVQCFNLPMYILLDSLCGVTRNSLRLLSGDKL